MKVVKLPSGATLKITPVPFAVAKALYQALLREAKGVEVKKGMDVIALYKNLFCAGFTSDEVEECLKKCLERCTYNNGKGDLKIDDDTFEPIEARQDYFTLCFEVGKETVLPFVKSLYAEWSALFEVTGVGPT